MWVWAVAGVGAVYVYKKATAAQAPATTATTADTSYGTDQGYPAYAGYDSGAGGGGVAGGSYDAGGAAAPAATDTGLPTEIPLTYSGGPIPVKVTIKRPHRRHQRHPGKGKRGGRGAHYGGKGVGYK